MAADRSSLSDDEPSSEPFGRVDGWVIACATIATIVILAVLTIGRIDISAGRYLRLDTAVRDAFSPRDLPDERYGDPSSYLLWYPAQAFLWNSLHHGKLPLWDRHAGGGFSPLTGFQFGVFHPLRWLAAAFPRDVMPSALIVLMLAAGWIGMYVAARVTESAPAAAAAAATIFVFSPGLFSAVHYDGMLLPLVHLPWIFALVVRFASSRRGSAPALLAVALALLILAGHASIIFLVCTALGISALGLARFRRTLRPIAGFAGASIAAILMTAFALLPPILALPNSWSYKTATLQGVGFRTLKQGTLLKFWTMVVIDRMKNVFPDQPPSYCYVGLPLIVLLLFAAYSYRKLGPQTRLALIMTPVWMLALVPGPWMTVVQHLPPFRYFANWYYAGVLSFWISLAAAGTLHLVRRRAVLRLGAYALAALALTSYFSRAIRIVSPEQLQPVVGGEVVAKLGRSPEPVRITGTAGQVHAPNLAALTAVDDARLPPLPLLPRRYHLWWESVDPAILTRAYATTRVTDHLASPLVGDFNVAFVLEGRLRPFDVFWSLPDPTARDRFLSPLLASSQFPVVFVSPSLLVHANRASPVRPRAHFAARVTNVRDLDAAVRLIRSDPQIVAGEAIVESFDHLPLPPVASGKAMVRYPSDGEAIVATASATGGLLVLHDAYDEGWQAKIDDSPARVLPVNILSRGVVVPAGQHVVTFHYMPRGLGAGSVISIASIVFGLFLVNWTSTKRTRARPPLRSDGGRW